MFRLHSVADSNFVSGAGVRFRFMRKKSEPRTPIEFSLTCYSVKSRKKVSAWRKNLWPFFCMLPPGGEIADQLSPQTTSGMPSGKAAIAASVGSLFFRYFLCVATLSYRGVASNRAPVSCG